MLDVAIVDYGMGNLRSVYNALRHVAPEADIEITDRAQTVRDAHLLDLVIRARDTNACTAPDRAKPRTSAQRVSQNIPAASASASQITSAPAA